MQINLNETNPFEKARNAFKSSSTTPKTFAEHKAEFENSNLGRQIEKAFTPQPYEIENKGLFRMAGVLSYACQFVSVTAAASFIFAFILSRINTIDGAWYIAFILSGAALFVIEYLLRRETAPVSRQILLGQLSVKLWRRMAFVLVLTSIGVTSSYLGGFDTAAAIATDKPIYTAPTPLSAPVIDLQQIQERYKPQIADAKQAAKEYKQKRLWNNRLSIADGNKYRKLLAVVTAKESDLNNEIKAATATNTEQREKTIQENNRRKQTTRTEYDELIVSYDNSINENGGGLAGLSVVAQFVFFCCLFFRSHYLIETVKQYSSPPPPENETDPNNDGDGKKARRKTDINDGFSDVLPDLNNPESGIYNGAKMRVLRGGKSAQTQFASDENHQTQTDKIVFVSTDLTIEHTDRQSRKIKRLNITQVRGNISANKSRLRKAKQTGTYQQIENIKSILVYWKAKEHELIDKAVEMERGAAVG